MFIAEVVARESRRGFIPSDNKHNTLFVDITV